MAACVGSQKDKWKGSECLGGSTHVQFVALFPQNPSCYSVRAVMGALMQDLGQLCSNLNISESSSYKPRVPDPSPRGSGLGSRGCETRISIFYKHLGES